MLVQRFLIAASLVSLGSLVACSTPTEVTTRDGRTITTPDKPDMDDDGFVTYEKGGREVKVNRDEVESIEEVK